LRTALCRDRKGQHQSPKGQRQRLHHPYCALMSFGEPVSSWYGDAPITDDPSIRPISRRF
jgi:hypothetical protein